MLSGSLINSLSTILHEFDRLKKASVLLKNVNYAPFLLFRQFSLKFREKSKQSEAAHILNIPLTPFS